MITSRNSHSEVHSLLKVCGNYQSTRHGSLLHTYSCLLLLPSVQILCSWTARTEAGCPRGLRTTASSTPLPALLICEYSFRATWPISCPTSAAGCYPCLCPEVSANSSSAAVLTAQKMPIPLPGPSPTTRGETTGSIRSSCLVQNHG